METTAQDELAFIRKMMADSQTTIIDDGKPSIVWGIIVSIGMLATYFAALADTDFGIAWMWIGLSVIGWLYVYYYRTQKVKTAKIKTLTGRLIGSIWGASGFAIGLVIMLTFVAPQVSGQWVIDPVALTSIASIILGIAYFMTGILYGKRWVRNISVGWWAGAAVMMFWPSVHVLMMYALMLIAFQIIPGVVMYRASKQSLGASGISA